MQRVALLLPMPMPCMIVGIKNDENDLEWRQGAARHPADFRGLEERVAVVGVEVGRRRAEVLNQRANFFL